MVSVCERLREDQGIELGQEDERVVDDGVVAFEIVVAKAAVTGHVDAEHEQIALSLDVRVDDDFDHRHRDAHARCRLNLLEYVFIEACVACCNL